MINKCLGLFGYDNLQKISTDEIADGENEKFDLTPPAGIIYELVGFAFTADEVDSSGGSGTHSIMLGANPAVGSPEKTMIRYTSDYTSKLEVYANGIAATADNTQIPANASEQIQAVKQFASAESGLEITYFNDSGLSASQLRIYYANVKMYKSLL
jgi:hypothetical protein